MINYIWFALIFIGILYSLFTNSFDIINNTILISGKKAIDLMFSLMPVIILWTGIMKIAEDSKLLQKFAYFVAPILSKIFPDIPKNNKALGYIASNIAANMLGLGSAATPFGLKAMVELEKINANKGVASRPMITFLVLNTAGVTLIPTTVLALRISYYSLNPSEIILPSIIATACSSISGLLLDYCIRKRIKK